MQKTLIRAAIAATLSLTLAPAVATAPVPTAPAQSISIALPEVPADQASGEAAHVHHEAPRVAPGQERADFHAWLARAPENRAAVKAFRAHLEAEGVEDVIPLWQLVRTSSSWRECTAGRFEVAPRDKWDNIVTTLKFIERDVIPAVGPVQAVSGYRNAGLNACSNGAPASAHRMFFALDLMPVDEDVSRADLVRGVCAAHARDGRTFNTGLGFYSGLRFHVDSSGFRKWGANGKGATSPCVTYS
jgi:hypothetical protein